MVQLTVVGSLNYDLVTYTERIPDAGETYKADAFETHIGGKGLNQTISIAKLIPEINDEYKVRMIGHVGNDTFGEELRGAVESHGVNVEDVEVLEGERSGVATILVEKSTGENRILITSGANGKTEYNEEDLDRLFPVSKEREIVVFQNEIPGTLSIIQWLSSQRYENTEIVYNPSPYYSNSTEVIELVDILIVNEVESLAIAKDILPEEEYKEFEKLTSDDSVNGFIKLSQNLKLKINQRKSNIVIITLGSIGSVATLPKSEDSVFVKSVPVEEVVDTTGAGDTFLGAILTQCSLGKGIKEAIEFASLASSLAIQRKGASESVPKYHEVVAQNRNSTSSV